MRRLARFAIAAAAGLAVGCLIPLLAYRLGLWAGGHRYMVHEVFRGSVPLALLLGVVAAVWPSSYLDKRRAVSAVTGAAIGLMFWYWVPRLLFWANRGYWPGFTGHVTWDFDIEAVTCWMAAGAAAMLLATGRRRGYEIVAVVLACAVALFLPDPLFNYITQNQELTIAVLVPVERASARTGPPRAVYDSSSMDAEQAAEKALRLARQSGVQGNYRVDFLYRTGKGRPSFAVIVLNGRVNAKASLAEPNHADLVYVQEPGEWRKIPATAATLERVIDVHQADKEEILGSFVVPDASGQSIGFAVWKQSD